MKCLFAASPPNCVVGCLWVYSLNLKVKLRWATSLRCWVKLFPSYFAVLLFALVRTRWNDSITMIIMKKIFNNFMCALLCCSGCRDSMFLKWKSFSFARREMRCCLYLSLFRVRIFFRAERPCQKGEIAVERRQKWMGKKLTHNLVEKKIREKLSMTIWDLLGNFFNTPEAADAAGLNGGAEHIEINLVLVLSSSSQPSPP